MTRSTRQTLAYFEDVESIVLSGKISKTMTKDDRGPRYVVTRYTQLSRFMKHHDPCESCGGPIEQRRVRVMAQGKVGLVGKISVAVADYSRAVAA